MMRRTKILLPSPNYSSKSFSMSQVYVLTNATCYFFRDENSQSSEFRVKHRCTLGTVDVPTYCVRFDYNDKYVAAAKGDGSIQIYNLFTGKMSYVCNENMENQMPTTIVR